MGKLRAAKKSRGHYAAKKETNVDEQKPVPTSSLETIVLRTKEKSFNSVKTKTSRPKSSNAEKPPVVQISKETVKKNDSPSNKDPTGTAKKGVSKKDRRNARQREWIKKLSNYQTPDKKEVKKNTQEIDDMQSLVNALPSLQEMGTTKKKTRKFTRKTLDAEIKNFVQVLEHPAFKKDPLGTIHLHLTNAKKRGLI